MLVLDVDKYLPILRYILLLLLFIMQYILHLFNINIYLVEIAFRIINSEFK